MKKFLSLVLIVVLAVALGGLYMVNNKRQAQTSEELSAKAAAAGEDVSSVNVTSDSGISAGSGEESASSVSSSSDKGAAQTKSTSGESVAAESVSSSSSSADDETQKAAGISIRGDNYNLDANDDTDSYALDLEELLRNNNISIPVENDTVDMAGSLTQLLYAGVDSAKIDDYISEHKAAATASGTTARDTEIMVRADIEPQTSRDDTSYVPVIFMGYNGGWNNDPEELIEQQQLILDTYTQKDEYIIVGLHPDRFTDTAGYDAAMKKAWGDHYLQMDGRISGNAMSSTGRTEIAQAIFDKLKELQYI